MHGLRFIAAFAVMLAHGLSYVIPSGQLFQHGWLRLVLNSANLGMSLFFVLSGFVIHLNYGRSVGIGQTGNRRFLIARFARLYPLFIVVFGASFLWLLWVQDFFQGQPVYFSGNQNANFDIFYPVPYFLSFTQTWFFLPLTAGYTVADGYPSAGLAQATGVMWSLSTEWFFYVAYIFIAPMLHRARGRRILLLSALTALGCWTAYLIVYANHGPITKWAVTHYGPVLGQNFYHWLVYMAPYGRIWEFLLGACAAQCYLDRRQTPPDVDRPWNGRLFTYGAMALWLAFHLAVCTSKLNYGAFASPLYAPMIAASAYAIARYRTTASRILGSRFMVAGGEGSYAQYLLHFLILHEFIAKWTPSHPGLIIPLLLAGFAATLLISFLVHRFFERPAQRWVQQNFDRLRLDIAFVASLASVTGLCLLGSLMLRAAANASTPPMPGLITIQSASFGANCGPGHYNNVYPAFRQACNGRSSCDFVYSITKLTDPVGGCNKAMTVTYQCGVSSPLNEFKIGSFDSEKKHVYFTCGGE